MLSRDVHSKCGSGVNFQGWWASFRVAALFSGGWLLRPLDRDVHVARVIT